MFASQTAITAKNLLPGIDLKTLAWGERTLLAQFTIRQGAPIPRHSHPYEQTGYLVNGRLQLTIGETTYTAEPGDSWCIAADEPHSACALTDCIAIEVFSPVRPDYLP
jgi:quercetin dioxygenase-like cupin family protein